MIKKYYKLSKNKMNVFKVFAYDEVGNDHYNSKNSIYKFSGYIKMDGFSKEKFNKILENIEPLLYKVPVIPSEIFVFDNSIEVRWTSNGFQIVNSKSKYLKLSLQFAEYLDNINIRGLKINTGSFLDDPTQLDKSKKYKFNYKPKFNSKCFGNRKSNKIFVIDFRN